MLIFSHSTGLQKTFTTTEEIQPATTDLPQPKKGMPKWAPDYLDALNQREGFKNKAGELIGQDYIMVFFNDHLPDGRAEANA